MSGNQQQTGPLRAGSAFMAALKENPEAQAGWARAQAYLRAFTEAMKSPEQQWQFERQRQDEQRVLAELAKAMSEGMRIVNDDLAASGFTPPKTTEDWEHLARIVEIPFETIQSGKFTARDVYVMALAWLDRQKIRMKLAEPSGTKTKDEMPAAYTVVALRKMTGLGNTALNQYAKSAGVKTPGRGQRNFRYSAADVRLILRTIIDTSSEAAVRDRCQATLKTLP